MQEKVNYLLKMINKKIKETEQKEISNSKIFKIRNVDDFYELNESDIPHDMQFILSDYLSANELEFVIEISKLDKNVKEYLRDHNNFNDEQKIMLESIINKLSTYKSEIIKNEEVKKLKTLKLKFEENNNELISEEEIDIIIELMRENNVNLKEQVTILKIINSINLNVCQLYNRDNSIIEEDDIINIDELPEYNNDEQEFIKIFNKYNLDWNLLPQKFHQKLIKHGNLDKIDSLLDYLNSKLPFILLDVKKYAEVLTKILLCSSKDIIENVINTVSTNNLIGFIESYPTILYPPIREGKRRTDSTGGHWEENKSGCSTYFLANIDYFQSINKLDIVKEKCSSVLIINPKTIKKSIKNLDLYGINLFDYPSPAISVLKFSNSHDCLDNAIEAGSEAFKYLKQNLSCISSSFHYIKYYLKSILPNPFTISSNGRLSLPTGFRQNKSDDKKVFDDYNATEAINSIPSKSYYDDIIGNSDNNEITDMSRTHQFILELDGSEYYNKEEPLVYNFNGVLISRIKVLRILETLLKVPEINIDNNVLLYVITYNSMLNDYEYNTIKECLKNLNHQRRP